MQQPHSATLDALRRVQVFLDAQATALGAVVPASLRARLDSAVTQLAGFQQEQTTAMGSATGETANQAVLRKDFRSQFMRPIARIAKGSLKTASDYPTLAIASSTLRNSDFASAAQSLSDTAAKYEKTLTDGGMPLDFLAQMKSALGQLTASKDAQDRSIARRKAATQGITDTDKIGHEVLVVLDSVIAPTLKKNGPLLADWKASKKIAGATPLPPQPTGLPVTGDTTATTTTTSTTGTPAASPVAAPSVAPPSTT